MAAAIDPTFREDMAAAIEAEQRALAAADAAQQRASSRTAVPAVPAVPAVATHESGELSRARRDVPAVPVVPLPAQLQGAAAAAWRADGGTAQGRATTPYGDVTGGDGVTRRAVL